MQMGNRLMYNKQTGRVLNGTLGERFDAHLTEKMANELRPSIENIGFIDLPYGDKTLENVIALHIDVNTKQIVIDKRIEPQITPEQQIQELENQLLISENEKVGGIL